MFNMAFGKDPSQVIFFDNQVGYYGSFANDLHSHLSQATTPSNRRSNLKDYLHAYSDRFIKACKCMDICDEEHLRPFRPDGVEAEYRDKAGVGFLFGMNYVFPRFVPDLPTEIDTINLKDNNELNTMVQVYLDFIDECVSNGALESLERYGYRVTL
jgi:hypothetical protein